MKLTEGIDAIIGEPRYAERCTHSLEHASAGSPVLLDSLAYIVAASYDALRCQR
jgi:hypothetical protein